MITLPVPWLLFPAVLGLLSLGSGLLLEWISGVKLPGALRMPAGLAAMIVAAQFTTMSSATAALTVPLVVGIAVAGFGITAGRRLRNPDGWAAGAGLATFAAYAAPVVLSGQATFTGYVKLDDTATFLGFTDQLMAHGRDLSGLAPSTYQVMLALNIGEGYPVGTFLPLGIGARLTGQDPACGFQPCMAFYAAMAALALYALLAGLVRSRPLRALIALVSAQAALLYGYALWGGIKEIAAAAMIALSAALVPVGRNELLSGRALLPFAAAAAAALGILGLAGLLWVGLLALPAIVSLARWANRPVRPALICVCATAILAIPSIAIAHSFIKYTSSNLLLASQRLGNLARPLKLIQIFGIWPNGDFRFTPGQYTLTEILIAVCALGAAASGAYALRRGAVRLPLVALICIAAALVLEHESPWLDAKALAEGSPFLVVLALAGAAAMVESGRRVPGAALAALVAGGVLWAKALAYHAAWLAPRSQLAELERIGERFAGDGPALMTEYQPSGVRHFLRRLDAEGASELRVRQVPLADGSILPTGQYADIDQFRYPDLLIYRTLVLRTSPVASRPSAPYQLVSQGRFYDVWQRPASGGPQVLEHLPFGSPDTPAAVPPCAEVRSAATRAATEGAVLATAAGSAPVLVPLNASLRARVILPTSGTYRVWLNGTFFRKVEITIDGNPAGSVATSGSLYAEFGSVQLTQGLHRVVVAYDSSDLRPGGGAPTFPIGPLAFSLAGPPAPVEYIEPSRAASLCGRSLDWLEIVRP